MNLTQAAGRALPPLSTIDPSPTATTPPITADLMSDDVAGRAAVSEKEANVGVPLGAHRDARALVRLVQCTQCSRPFRMPVTLPCGNSLCRPCLPQLHEREFISYPAIPGRRQAIQCPFSECRDEHPVSDCSVDVTMSKVMEAIGDVVARNAMVADAMPTLMEEVVRWDEGVGGFDHSSEKPAVHEMQGGRLVATYTLAAQGKLPYCLDLDYVDIPGASDVEQAKDTKVLSEVLEATQKEVDCQVCYNIMLDPVTTFCGHTLCRKCLARVLDHSAHCPVCRRDLLIPPSLTSQPSNQTLVNLLNGLCPETIVARKEAVALEERGEEGSGLDVPMFICTLGFPNQPTFLRVFEPRYRLMLRRALEVNREFGMLMYNRYFEPQGELGPVHFYHYGTMLRILHSQLLADGTSLVETRGLYRFRVKAYGTHDGYAVGSVERMEDVPMVEEERIEAEETSIDPTAVPIPSASNSDEDITAQINRMSTQALLEVGQDFIVRMRNRSAVWLQQRVLDIHGQPPADAALFAYWFASVLPISDEEKYKLLPTTTVRERLKITVQWIRRIESQRWYQTNSCRIL